MTERPCPKCGTDIDDQTCVTDDPRTQPEPGDYSLCLYCGTPLVFITGLKVRTMTHSEYVALSPDLQLAFAQATEVARLARSRMGLQRK